MKTKFLALLLLALLSSTLNAVPIDNRNPPSELIAIRDSVRAAGPVRCTFTESRHFPFSREPRILTGICTFVPDRGLMLAYETPQVREIALIPDAMVEFSGAERREHTLPAQYAKMLPIFNLDIGEMGDGFSADFATRNNGWTLTLKGEQKSVATDKQRTIRTERVEIAIRGKGSHIFRLEIIKPGAITISIDMGDPTSLTPAELADLEGKLGR